jgi:hypothetical protein
VPASRLAGLVLEVECEDGLAVLDGILAVGIVAAESGVDGIEGLGRRESVCERESARGGGLAFELPLVAGNGRVLAYRS